MKTNKQIILSALLTVLLCPLVSDAAAAQSRSQVRRGDPVGVRIDDLRIQVLEVGSRREIGWVEPGGTLTIPEGMRVRLIMTATGVNGKTFYPYTEFSDPSRGGLRISKSSEENANATVEVPRGKGREWTSSLRYQITENVNLPSSQRSGFINLRVVPDGQWSAPGTSQPGGGASWSSDVAPGYQARDITQALYRGILLRDLDETGARGFIANIERNGYSGILDVARQIAVSQESRQLSYQRNEERLQSLYQHLLGYSSNNVSRSQWENDLRRLNAGDVYGVVEDILQSERFRNYYRVDGVINRR
jgi:hypothetical protein